MKASTLKTDCPFLRSFSPRAEKSLQHTLEAFSEPDDDEDDEAGRFSPLPNKRVRVSDINITRYQEEFLELAEIATGSFGMVKQARHRLDDIVYAIKVSKTKIRVNSHDEKMAMNEVFAHAALMKHKHVVRYFNSWVEKGQVFIQNEYCEGGSLQKLIEDRRHSGQKFSESELKRILVQVTKGLHYIHSNQLVHLDIKPGNILISVEHTPTPSPQRTVELSDSGAASGDLSPRGAAKVELCSSTESSPGDGDKVCYKIGDLGHVCQQEGGDLSPEEGDCRYMAPEFLQMEVDKSQLTKADIFSLGMTIYEAASLRVLPKNSSEGAEGEYGDLKHGRLRYLDDYSEEFNNLLARMVHANPSQRPTANRLLANCELSPGMNKSKWQLQKELNETKEKMLLLEAQLKLANDNSKKDRRKRTLVGRGSAKADSCQM
jgi:wee1-like protein kinase